jgi:hypothetical protein
MDLSYQAAMIAVDIEEDKAAGMERLSLEFEQLDSLLAEIDEQMFNYDFARRAMLTTRIAKRVIEAHIHDTPQTRQ